MKEKRQTRRQEQGNTETAQWEKKETKIEIESGQRKGNQGSVRGKQRKSL